ncbi:MAG: D-glycero-beta-D-manno-heptose-7-phosphate kinase [Candidatus Woesearchaeota archaeon]|jgi:D-beta-D-heptose 7-phosphate kinase/D-beta-D-heptose 1-phosphate adenosyltransferase|nr:D-glycero-beta-D-manno-heptose-7-phosphate kinase [Candidatus Woesearchaeota archaeon]MDP7323599.1 D-glycero-beta-D-manno-heptose-7-phosphate kinase [Candidatus Woesearchaeota archaeon]MDP7458200.1 D-glycero-beta-D-manno-heptose-7-phosphate kinase [Candidatus Woesearchaeota archaeon]
MNKGLIGLVEKFKEKRILVIGDIMLDKYIRGNVKRISPEAPVQVVSVEKEDYAPGGAANVATNITGLGAGALIIGFVGDDETKDVLLSELKKREIFTEGVVVDNKRPTIQKVRVLGQNQQLLRFDYEKNGGGDELVEEELIKNIKELVKGVDAVIISDYNKGVITQKTIDVLSKIVKEEGKIVVVDPKPKNLKFYNGFSLITPNYNEAVMMANLTGEASEDIEKVGKGLLNELGSTLLVTQGEKGMSLFESEGKITHIPTKAKEVYDVTGAGDTVVAVLTLALCSGASMKQAAIIANHAAGVVVGKVGTSTVTVEEIGQSLGTENE